MQEAKNYRGFVTRKMWDVIKIAFGVGLGWWLKSLSE